MFFLTKQKVLEVLAFVRLSTRHITASVSEYERVVKAAHKADTTG